MRVSGLVLAAGAGRRMGRPKALVRDADGTSWLVRAVGTLTEGGCQGVTVVLGARAQEARGLVPEGIDVVVADDWADGQSASLRAGLTSLTADSDAVVVTLVDLPDVTADVVRRVVAQAGPALLSRATYDARPGHPVLLGRDHWTAIAESATGDDGAKAYLRAHGVRGIECGDLASGHDQDTPTESLR